MPTGAEPPLIKETLDFHLRCRVGHREEFLRTLLRRHACLGFVEPFFRIEKGGEENGKEDRRKNGGSGDCGSGNGRKKPQRLRPPQPTVVV